MIDQSTKARELAHRLARDIATSCTMDHLLWGPLEQKIASALRAARNEALEEAALAAEGDYPPDEPLSDKLTPFRAGRFHAAEAIRSLKDKPEKDNG